MSHVNESIVLVGGGGGVYRTAKPLKLIRPNITTIQTVFDHAHHSGELRDERGMLPPGDIRQAILALSDDNQEPTLRMLMSYRFSEKGDSSLNHTSLGNILLTALTEILGSLPAAINFFCKLNNVRGKVLPVSLDDCELCAVLCDGTVICGEGKIDNRSSGDDRKIVRTFLDPKAHVYVPAYEAVVHADKVVLCPGSFYTSLIPNLLVDGFVDALRESHGRIMYVVNLMTNKSETDGFLVSDFLRVLTEHIGRKLDVVVYNSEALEPSIEQKYKAEKSYLVLPGEDLDRYAYKVLSALLVDTSGGVIRHHQRIASIIADL